MKERLSALVDAEDLTDAEKTALFGRLRADDEIRDAWEMYHLIGDTLRGTAGAGLDRQAFAARLAAEPTVLAPAARPVARPRPSATRWVVPMAASLAAVGFVAWMASVILPAGAPTNTAAVVSAPEAAAGVENSAPVVAAAPVVVTPTPTGTVVAAPSIALPPATIPVASGVDDYLWAHQRFAPAASAYRVRTVRHEGR